MIINLSTQTQEYIIYGFAGFCLIAFIIAVYRVRKKINETPEQPRFVSDITKFR